MRTPPAIAGIFIKKAPQRVGWSSRALERGPSLTRSLQERKYETSGASGQVSKGQRAAEAASETPRSTAELATATYQ